MIKIKFYTEATQNTLVKGFIREGAKNHEDSATEWATA